MTILRSGWLTAAYRLNDPDTVQVLGFMHHNTGDAKLERATETLWRAGYLDAVELATKDFRPYKPTWEGLECWIGPNDFVVSTWRINELEFSEDGSECAFVQLRGQKEPLERRLSIVTRIKN